MVAMSLVATVMVLNVHNPHSNAMKPPRVVSYITQHTTVQQTLTEGTSRISFITRAPVENKIKYIIIFSSLNTGVMEKMILPPHSWLQTIVNGVT